MNKLQSSVELSLLKLLLKEKAYKEFSKFIRIPEGLREVKLLYHSLELLHSRHPGTDKSVDDLAIMVSIAYPQMREPEKEAIHELLEKARASTVSDDVLTELVKGIQIRSLSHTLALKALDVSEGRAEVEELSDIFNSFKKTEAEDLNDDKRCFVTDDLFELEKHTIMGPGLKWRLSCLNLSLGPLRVGDFGFVFARPESGKTTFLADQCTYMAGQANGPIIWFNNEEQGEKVRLRMYQAALGIRTDELWTNKKKTIEAYREATKNQLYLYDDKTIHKQDVERIVDIKKPALIVFDQIDKIKGFKADRPDLVYGETYQWARQLAKNQCAIIGVCQSDGTGEGVRWLTMNHVAEAKTSKQAEADWILGIGKSHDMNTESVRYLNISKNKLLGDAHTDPNERHGRFEVFLKPQIARYEDIT